MDSAKSKYIEFLPIALDLLSENGVILMDDIFQGGEIIDPNYGNQKKSAGARAWLTQAF